MVVTVYMCTNKINGKRYVGVDSCWPSRKSRHERGDDDYAFQRAIKKYGKNNFEWKIVVKLDDKDQALAMERELIKEYNTKVPNGYNLTEGGEGCWGWKQSPETIAKRVRSLTGRKFSPEHIENLRKSHMGYVHTEEQKRKIGESGRGRKLSEETRARQRIAAQRRSPGTLFYAEGVIGTAKQVANYHKITIRTVWNRTKSKRFESWYQMPEYDHDISN